MYLLTDVTEPDSGNFTVFPGSHLRPFAERAERMPGPKTPGTVPLLGKAGDAYVFPHALWHGPSPNHSGKARKTILYNYCQMFMRAYDYSGPYTGFDGFVQFAKDIDMSVHSPTWKFITPPWRQNINA